MNLHGIEAAFNQLAINEGGRPNLRFADDTIDALAKITRSGLRYGGSRALVGGAGCGAQAGAILIALIAATFVGIDQLLCLLASPEWDGLKTYIGDRGIKYIKGVLVTMHGNLMRGTFLQFYGHVGDLWESLSKTVGTGTITWHGILKPLKVVCKWIGDIIDSYNSNVPAELAPAPPPPPVLDAQKLDILAAAAAKAGVAIGGRRRRRSRRSIRGGSCGSKLGGSRMSGGRRTRRRRRRAGSKR